MSARALAALGVAALLIGAVTLDTEAGLPGPVPEPPPSAGRHGPPMDRAKPVSLAVPALELHTRSLVRLGLTDTDRLEAPGPWQAVGWWSGGAAPGEKGAAVLAGHVDSRTGPAVFFGLDRLERGHRIRVGRADGTTARFAVERVSLHAKDDFPTRRVYEAEPGRAELRLITCGGAFDAASGRYTANTVVYARLVG
ncbi:class F sortase [Streptomonospora wellingtoniae]|uniref:Class F sortase n=1 Tax=Streptomonospora wellingtoniae TaxID=3075544 RepID=A0ABU2L0S4_9ACTN|nr:class F sortase [Streptomonospora sp. DSM 45055]MDT0305006.1 class F sortase [Streptomonospora sp. DSM 45055]